MSTDTCEMTVCTWLFIGIVCNCKMLEIMSKSTNDELNCGTFIQWKTMTPSVGKKEETVGILIWKALLISAQPGHQSVTLRINNKNK